MLIALGVFVSAFALSPSVPFSCVALFFAGAAMMGVFSMVNSLVQLVVTNQMRGRVMSVYNLSFRSGMPVVATRSPATWWRCSPRRWCSPSTARFWYFWASFTS